MNVRKHGAIICIVASSMLFSACSTRPDIFDRDAGSSTSAEQSHAYTPSASPLTASAKVYRQGNLCPIIMDYATSTLKLDPKEVIESPVVRETSTCSYYGGQGQMNFDVAFNPNDSVVNQLGDPSNSIYAKVAISGHTVYIKTQFIGDSRTNWPAYDCYVDTPRGLLSDLVQHDTDEVTGYDIALGLLRAALPAFTN